MPTALPSSSMHVFTDFSSEGSLANRDSKEESEIILPKKKKSETLNVIKQN
jgi:hypothetical protein